MAWGNHQSFLCPHVQASVVEVLGVVEANGEEAEQATEQLERLLFVLHTLVSHKDGAKITKPEAVCQVTGEHCHIQKTVIPEPPKNRVHGNIL